MGWKTCCVSFETLRKETGLLYVFFFFFLERALGNVYGKTCVGHWNLLKEKEYSMSAEPVFVITNATEKVFIVHSLTRFFVLRVL